LRIFLANIDRHLAFCLHVCSFFWPNDFTDVLIKEGVELSGGSEFIKSHWRVHIAHNLRQEAEKIYEYHARLHAIQNGMKLTP
jgi:hypothetical protein